MWYLYVLACRGGGLYTGISTDVARRYAAHLAGRGARYTRSFAPQRIVLVVAYPDKSTALAAEYALKAMPAAQKRAWLVAQGADIGSGTA